jgi:uncharacterized protein YjbJ (UPF0337 family)
VVFIDPRNQNGAGGTFRRGRRCSAAKRRSNEETVMDWSRVEGNWKQVKGKLKEKWGQLTDDDLDKIAGRREQLEGKIQERYGLTRDMVRKDVDDWLRAQT